MKSSFIPKKSLGQHFLVNPRILDRIVAAAEITRNDIVLEIGPGTGNLTEKLAEKVLRQGSGQAGKVIAVEKDEKLAELLKNKFVALKAIANIATIIQGDILKIDFDDLGIAGDYKVVGNIPYYITGKILRLIFEKWPRPKLVVLTIQKEVAQRIIAKPPKMNLLAVSVQFFAEPKITGYISKENFRPRPKVDSVIIKLIPKSKSYVLNSKSFFSVVRAGFSQKRKILISNLEKKLKLKKKTLTEVFNKAGIDSKNRAENLSIDDWIKLVNHLEYK